MDETALVPTLSAWDKAEDARMRWLLQAAPDATAIVDSAGRIVTMNSQLEKLFGYRRAELIGQPIDSLVPMRFRTEHPDHRRWYIEDPQPRLMAPGQDVFALRSDGSEFPAEISLSSLLTPEGILVSVGVRDLTERRRAEEERFQLAAIVDSSDDAILSLRLDGRITSWNRSAERIFRYAADEAIGMSLSKLLPEDDNHSDVNDMFARLRDGGTVAPHDAVRCRSDGAEIDVSISMSAIRDHRGVLVGAAQVVRDITERKQAEAALFEAKEAAITASQAFEAFSYSVAHDLRSPLRAIDGFSEALAEEYNDALDETGQDYLRRVRDSAQRMSQLIDSLLLLARVTHHELARSPVDLSALAGAAATRLAEDAPGRDVVVDIQPGLRTHGDPVLLANALDNLIGNAWKFTTLTPGARIEFGRDAAGYFVRDNGAGFDMAYSAKLFGVFQRLHSVEDFSGTGIGLATVQRVVRRHGGKIWAEGEVGRGATFHFTLTEGPP